MPKKKVLICDDHSTVETSAIEARELVEDMYPGEVLKKGEKRKLLTLLNRIILANERATESGRNMESRMRDYRESIENLGFRRKR